MIKNYNLSIIRNNYFAAILQVAIYFFCVIILYALFSTEIVGAQEPAKLGIKLLDAVKITLTKQPNIHLQKEQAKLKKGNMQSARGQFDTTLNISTGYNHEEIPLSTSQQLMQDISKTETDTTSYEVNLSKQFRTGITVSPGIKMTRTEISSYSSDPTNEARADFLVTVPLLKGRGVKATGANEMAAEKEYEISLFELQHTISENILNTVLAYWKYLGAIKTLDQLKESESRAQAFVRETKTFIMADKRPAAELEQALANLADKTISRIAGEQRIFEEKHNLGLAMGISFNEIESLPLPTDIFFLIKDEDIAKIYAVRQELIKESLDRRADYLASKDQKNYHKVLLTAARNNLLSKLDLNFNLGYSGLDEGTDSSTFITPLYNNVPGLSFALSLNYQWPFANNSARGFLLQKRSAYEQSVIAARDLARNISSRIMVSIAGLRSSASELARSQEAVASYRNAVDNERKKFKLGISTLLDLMQIEDRLTNALLNKISAHLKLSNSLARLRFETGTLLTAEQTQISVGMEELTTIPLLQ